MKKSTIILIIILVVIAFVVYPLLKLYAKHIVESTTKDLLEKGDGVNAVNVGLSISELTCNSDKIIVKIKLNEANVQVKGIKIIFNPDEPLNIITKNEAFSLNEEKTYEFTNQDLNISIVKNLEVYPIISLNGENRLLMAGYKKSCQ